MDSSDPNQVSVSAAEFLQVMYYRVPDGALEITFIAPKELGLYPKTNVLWKDMPLVIEDPAMRRVHQLNAAGYGAYFGLAVRAERKVPEWRINEKTGERYFVEHPRGWQKDARWLTALFVDVDAKDYDSKEQALKAVKRINPSILVDSGGGFHGYLLLNEPLLITDENRSSVKRCLKGLAKSIKADPHVAELARVFRLPETVNTKPGRDHAICRVSKFNLMRYAYEDLFEEYAPLIPISTPRSYDPGEIDQDEIARALSYIPPKDIGYDEWIAVLAGLTHSLGSGEALRLAERWTGYCSESGEIESKISSFDNATGSQTASLGTIFFLARRFGYHSPSRKQAAPQKKGAKDGGGGGTGIAMSISNKLTIGQHLSTFGL